jgi:hypothetical protein
MALQVNDTISNFYDRLSALQHNPQFSQNLNKVIENNNKYETLKLTGKYSLILVYLAYLIFVLFSWNPKRILRHKNKIM